MHMLPRVNWTAGTRARLGPSSAVRARIPSGAALGAPKKKQNAIIAPPEPIKKKKHIPPPEQPPIKKNKKQKSIVPPPMPVPEAHGSEGEEDEPPVGELVVFPKEHAAAEANAKGNKKPN